jgi:hypothetical protein
VDDNFTAELTLAKEFREVGVGIAKYFGSYSQLQLRGAIFGVYFSAFNPIYSHANQSVFRMKKAEAIAIVDRFLSLQGKTSRLHCHDTTELLTY